VWSPVRNWPRFLFNRPNKKKKNFREAGGRRGGVWPPPGPRNEGGFGRLRPCPPPGTRGVGKKWVMLIFGFRQNFLSGPKGRKKKKKNFEGGCRAPKKREPQDFARQKIWMGREFFGTHEGMGGEIRAKTPWGWAGETGQNSFSGCWARGGKGGDRGEAPGRKKKPI